MDSQSFLTQLASLRASSTPQDYLDGSPTGQTGHKSPFTSPHALDVLRIPSALLPHPLSSKALRGLAHAAAPLALAEVAEEAQIKASVSMAMSVDPSDQTPLLDALRHMASRRDSGEGLLNTCASAESHSPSSSTGAAPVGLDASMFDNDVASGSEDGEEEDEGEDGEQYAEVGEEREGLQQAWGKDAVPVPPVLASPQHASYTFPKHVAVPDRQDSQDVRESADTPSMTPSTRRLPTFAEWGDDGAPSALSAGAGSSGEKQAGPAAIGPAPLPAGIKVACNKSRFSPPNVSLPTRYSNAALDSEGHSPQSPTARTPTPSEPTEGNSGQLSPHHSTTSITSDGLIHKHPSGGSSAPSAASAAAVRPPFSSAHSSRAASLVDSATSAQLAQLLQQLQAGSLTPSALSQLLVQLSQPQAPGAGTPPVETEAGVPSKAKRDRKSLRVRLPASPGRPMASTTPTMLDASYHSPLKTTKSLRRVHSPGPRTCDAKPSLRSHSMHWAAMHKSLGALSPAQGGAQASPLKGSKSLRLVRTPASPGPGDASPLKSMKSVRRVPLALLGGTLGGTRGSAEPLHSMASSGNSTRGAVLQSLQGAPNSPGPACSPMKSARSVRRVAATGSPGAAADAPTSTSTSRRAALSRFSMAASAMANDLAALRAEFGHAFSDSDEEQPLPGGAEDGAHGGGATYLTDLLADGMESPTGAPGSPRAAWEVGSPGPQSTRSLMLAFNRAAAVGSSEEEDEEECTPAEFNKTFSTQLSPTMSGTSASQVAETLYTEGASSSVCGSPEEASTAVVISPPHSPTQSSPGPPHYASRAVSLAAAAAAAAEAAGIDPGLLQPQDSWKGAAAAAAPSALAAAAAGRPEAAAGGASSSGSVPAVGTFRPAAASELQVGRLPTVYSVNEALEEAADVGQPAAVGGSDGAAVTAASKLGWAEGQPPHRGSLPGDAQMLPVVGEQPPSLQAWRGQPRTQVAVPRSPMRSLVSEFNDARAEGKGAHGSPSKAFLSARSRPPAAAAADAAAAGAEARMLASHSSGPLARGQPSSPTAPANPAALDKAVFPAAAAAAAAAARLGSAADGALEALPGLPGGGNNTVAGGAAALGSSADAAPSRSASVAAAGAGSPLARQVDAMRGQLTSLSKLMGSICGTASPIASASSVDAAAAGAGDLLLAGRRRSGSSSCAAPLMSVLGASALSSGSPLRAAGVRQLSLSQSVGVLPSEVMALMHQVQQEVSQLRQQQQDAAGLQEQQLRALEQVQVQLQLVSQQQQLFQLQQLQADPCQAGPLGRPGLMVTMGSLRGGTAVGTPVTSPGAAMAPSSQQLPGSALAACEHAAALPGAASLGGEAMAVCTLCGRAAESSSGGSPAASPAGLPVVARDRSTGVTYMTAAAAPGAAGMAATAAGLAPPTAALVGGPGSAGRAGGGKLPAAGEQLLTSLLSYHSGERDPEMHAADELSDSLHVVPGTPALADEPSCRELCSGAVTAAAGSSSSAHSGSGTLPAQVQLTPSKSPGGDGSQGAGATSHGSPVVPESWGRTAFARQAMGVTYQPLKLSLTVDPASSGQAVTVAVCMKEEGHEGAAADGSSGGEPGAGVNASPSPPTKNSGSQISGSDGSDTPRDDDLVGVVPDKTSDLPPAAGDAATSPAAREPLASWFSGGDLRLDSPSTARRLKFDEVDGEGEVSPGSPAQRSASSPHFTDRRPSPLNLHTGGSAPVGAPAGPAGAVQLRAGVIHVPLSPIRTHPVASPARSPAKGFQGYGSPARVVSAARQHMIPPLSPSRLTASPRSAGSGHWAGGASPGSSFSSSSTKPASGFSLQQHMGLVIGGCLFASDAEEEEPAAEPAAAN